MARKGSLRGFEELKIFANPAQTAHERFPKPRESPPARVASYRNNLVALSQYYNLFFITSLDKILVYQPVNQAQYLTNPSLSISLASSNHGLIGYMDPSNSHAINQLIVADLGIEEIMIAACDDGDVIAYTTRSIQKEIELRALDLNDRQNFGPELRPFFVSNVGMSAWGIAVHKEARMIAVSSNSKKINNFAFAVSDSKCSTPEARSDDDMFDVNCLKYLDDQEWARPTGLDVLDPSDRHRNLEIILSSHWTNIPNVAFFNGVNKSADIDVYLVSTDVDGVTYVWDVWKRKVIIQLTSSIDNLGGWGVACIDPYFCRDANSPVEIFGVKEVSPDLAVVNITHAAKNVPESSEDHFTLRNQTAYDPAPEELEAHEAGSEDDENTEDEVDLDFNTFDDLLGLNDQSGDEASGLEDDVVGEDDEDSESETQSLLHEPTSLDDQYQTMINDYGHTLDPVDHQGHIVQGVAATSMTYDTTDIMDHVEPMPNAPVTPLDPAAALEEAEQAVDPDFSTLPQSVMNAIRNRLNSLNSFAAPSYASNLQPRLLPFYVLQTNHYDIRLFHAIQPAITQVSPTKVVVCRLPLHQHLHPSYQALSRIERLNMVLQIPELGVMVVGDQMGRVAFLTMTRCRAKTNSPRDDKVGFRFERFLPLTSQEDDDQRPKTELLGIAVGPVSNELLKRADGLSDDDKGYGYSRRREAWRDHEGSRRYRLMLYYRDHTVLSYEFGRSSSQKSDSFMV